MVIVSPSADTVARVTPPSSCCPPLAHQPGEPVRPQPDLDAVHPHVDPLDQQPTGLGTIDVPDDRRVGR